jgi:peptidoglycan/LPS O-acetylase OafA/YrhL
MKENKLKDVCPACGVPRTAFEPFKDTISKKRRTILEFNLHPISVHFPQAFTSAIPPFILLALMVPVSIGNELLTTVTVLSYFLPLTVLPAIFFGIVDGKTRLKKIGTPLLFKKITVATVLLILTLILSLVAYSYGTEYPGNLYIFIIALGCIACQIILGEIGKTLMNSKMPG